jgi:hypothetical protein
MWSGSGNNKLINKFLKYPLLLILVVFAVIQFFRPSKNSEPTELAKILPTDMNANSEVTKILATSCFDCHSNCTNYPWYADIQPIGWWMSNHIQEGKKAINFSDFENLGLIRRRSKLESILKQIQQDKMPLSSYMKLHPESRLNEQQKRIITDWVKSLDY